MRTNLFHIVLSAFFLTIGFTKVSAQELQNKTLKVEAQKPVDSLIINSEDFFQIKDTVINDSLELNKNKSFMNQNNRHPCLEKKYITDAIKIAASLIDLYAPLPAR